MKTWKIPVSWRMTGIVEIKADTLAEALTLAEVEDVGLPDGSYVDGSFEVDGIAEDEENVCPVCRVPIKPDGGDDDGDGWLYLYWKCDKCGSAGRAFFDRDDGDAFDHHVVDTYGEQWEG